MIGIIGAMAEEVAALKQEMLIEKEAQIHAIRFYIGEIAGQPCVLMQGGIGKVNAAYATTLLMENYHPDYLINIGSAGGLKSTQRVGDVVIGQSVAHHDFDCTAFGRSYGQVPGLPVTFDSEEKLLKATSKALCEMNQRYHTGLVVSGDQFIHTEEQIQTILQHFPNAVAAEMEAASVAQIAYLYQVPFVIIRSLSDVYQNGDHSRQFDTYLALASRQSALLTKKVIGEIYD